ncbi:MAG: hypothetical protein AB2603_15905 [Candidatus Thiodiazotropha endolucinida]
MTTSTDVNSIREMVKQGLSVDEAIHMLHQHNLTITQSMKFLVEEYSIGLAEAKGLVANHPVWHDIVKASEPLKEELVDSMNKAD